MANHLINAEIIPDKINSGELAKLAIEYQSETQTTLQIDYDATAFEVEPDVIPLPRSQAGFERLRVRISKRGTSSRCEVTFRLFDEADADAVEVV